jgi:hypothetical protein
MLVSVTTLLGSLCEVWASLVPSLSRQVFCNTVHRAHIVLQIVVNRRNDPLHCNVEMHYMDDLNKMDAWLGTIPAGTDKARMAFVYDVLVEETEGTTG